MPLSGTDPAFPQLPLPAANTSLLPSEYCCTERGTEQCPCPAASSSPLTLTRSYKETEEFLHYFYCFVFSVPILQNDCPLRCSVTRMCLLGSFKLFALLFHVCFSAGISCLADRSGKQHPVLHPSSSARTAASRPTAPRAALPRLGPPFQGLNGGFHLYLWPFHLQECLVMSLGS